jgi:hypothetical protein
MPPTRLLKWDSFLRHVVEQLQKKIAGADSARGRDRNPRAYREAMEGVTKSVNVSFESPTGPLPLSRANTYLRDRQSSDPGVGYFGPVEVQMPAEP